MLYRQIVTIFLLINISSLTQGFVARPHDKIYSKRHLLRIYPDFDLERFADDGGKKEGGGGSECSSNKNCGASVSKGDPKVKASNIAQKAAVEAKAANDAQTAAADAAAAQVKLELADKAMQSARAAEAALAGKQQIMEQLQREMAEADAVVTEVTASLQNTQANANAAATAAQQAQAELNDLKRIVAASTGNLANIENVSSGAQQELAEKMQLLEAAKNRVEGLQRQMVDARQDFEKTKQAAYKAACAAVEAKQKAQMSPGQ
ncbi:uncharacterized protein LOC115621551 [Scaptodrosophila lebanonensis]|uniref:Uncharacterized protein LOC115621551 n=1 Tax=Drosophila lebanonensis TaxID=7225 RepID=A0A6J2T716_DROLE|nr:uncharacterized protein LOC115621551 [Scaptodrosophila lebanonensis]